MLAYDGNPLVPNKLVLFEFIQRYRYAIACARSTLSLLIVTLLYFNRVTSLSLSPRYLQVLQQAGLKPNTKFDLSTLRSICSAGSPLTVEHYLFVKTCIKHVYIQNVSGMLATRRCVLCSIDTGMILTSGQAVLMSVLVGHFLLKIALDIKLFHTDAWMHGLPK